MNDPRSFVVSIATRRAGAHVGMRAILTLDRDDLLKGEAEEALVHEARVLWRRFQRRVRDIDDGQVPA